jgi:NAD-dependent DNA ligase
MSTSIAQQIQVLRQELHQADYEYYQLSAPSLSDYEYDIKMRRLQELEKTHPELVSPDSPSQRVGSDLSRGLSRKSIDILCFRWATPIPGRSPGLFTTEYLKA